MIKETQKNKVITTNFNNTHLSIQLRSDGFSFCILNKNSGKIIDIQDFSNNNNSPSKQLELIKSVFEQNDSLKHHFESINVTHSNNLATLVPKPFFDETKLSDYLQYNIKVLKNDFITFDTIDNTDIVNVFIPFVHINNYLFDIFGTFEYKHTSTVLIETLLKQQSNSESTNFYVYVENDIFQVVVIKNKKVVFFNTFNYKTKEDFIYYILFTAEQLQLNPEEFSLTFLNAIEEKSELYKITFKYVKNIQFFKPSYSIPKELNCSNHSYFTLLNQH